MRVFINGFIFCVTGWILSTADLGYTTWQYWAILVLMIIVYLKAKLEED